MAVKFNGTDQGLAVGGARGQFRNVAASTICAWARIESELGATNRIIVKFAQGTGDNTTRVSIGITTTFGIQIGCRVLDADSLASHTILLGTPPAIGDWHHYAVAFNFATRTFQLYYDGALVNTTIMTAVTAGSTSDTASRTGGIGIAGLAPPGNSFWPGSIDDVIFYNRVLGPTEIQTIYTGRGQAFILDGITGHWQLAEGGEGVIVATAADVSGLGGAAVGVLSPTYTGGVTSTHRRRKRPEARR
jgi:hypothetical protein